MKNPGIRRLKWIGDPPMLMEDGWTIPNWDYENNRVVALVGYANRTLTPDDIPGLSKVYVWGKAKKRGQRATWKEFIQDVDEIDAQLILAGCPDEFRDVTDHPTPETVRHDPVIIYKDKDTGKYYRAS